MIIGVRLIFTRLLRITTRRGAIRERYFTISVGFRERKVIGILRSRVIEIDQLVIRFFGGLPKVLRSIFLAIGHLGGCLLLRSRNIFGHGVGRFWLIATGDQYYRHCNRRN